MLRFWPACFGDSQPADGAGWHDGGVLLTLSGHDPVDVVPVGSLYWIWIWIWSAFEGP